MVNSGGHPTVYLTSLTSAGVAVDAVQTLTVVEARQVVTLIDVHLTGFALVASRTRTAELVEQILAHTAIATRVTGALVYLFLTVDACVAWGTIQISRSYLEKNRILGDEIEFWKKKIEFWKKKIVFCDIYNKIVLLF